MNGAIRSSLGYNGRRSTEARRTSLGRKKRNNSSSGQEEKSIANVSDKPRSGNRFEIDIFRGWCKRCGICAAFCPRQCIGLDEDGAQVNVRPDRCTGYDWCEVHCPDFAISVHRAKAEEQKSDGD